MEGQVSDLSTPRRADSPVLALLSGIDRSILIGLGLLVALTLLGALLVPGFLSVRNARSILLLAAFLGIASIGQTLSALLGALDLSIPYVIGAANILLPSLMVSGLPSPVAIVLVVLLGILVGALNGLLSYRIQGQALILSLGLGFAVVGGTQIYTSWGSQFGGTVFATIPAWLSNLAAFNGTTFGAPVPPVVLIWALIAAATIWTMSRTWFGCGVYAVGGSRLAARRLRFSEFHTWVAAHAISGASSAVAGTLLLGFSGGGFVGVGDPYLFTTVAAVVIGGTSLLGGAGGYGSTVIGVLVLTLLTSLLVGLGLSFAAQQVVIGLLIPLMVAVYARAPHIRNQI